AVFPALIGHRAREPLISAEDGPSSSRGKRGPAARRRRTGRTVVSRRPEGEDTLLSVAARNRQPLSRLQLTVQLTAASSRYSPSVNRRDAARTFSSRCSIEEVPGMGNVTGDRFSSQARAICFGVLRWFCAILSSSIPPTLPDPSGNHGMNAIPLRSQ